MNENKTQLSARSRAPIDDIGIKWWDQYGTSECSKEPKKYYVQNEVEKTKEEKKIADKSTNTLDSQPILTSESNKDFNPNTLETKNPKDIVLKKWREDQAEAKYEQARKAVINSLKIKFGAAPKHANIHPIPVANKTYIRKKIPSVIITGDNVKEISNLNSKDLSQRNLGLAGGGYRVEIGDGNDEGACHASRLQMGPGGELAQWKLASGGSRAAGAEGGIRGFAREDDMPARDGKIVDPILLA